MSVEIVFQKGVNNSVPSYPVTEVNNRYTVFIKEDLLLKRIHFDSEFREFINTLCNAVIKSKITRRSRLYRLEEFLGRREIYDYLLNGVKREDFKSIISEVKKLEEIKLNIFLFNLENLSKIYVRSGGNTNIDLKENLKRVKTGQLNKRLVSDVNYTFCSTTYEGFASAFRQGTIYTSKVEIDGKLKRVFIKTPLHTYFGGFNLMFIDPQTLNVFSFTTDKHGKINEFRKIVTFDEFVKRYGFVTSFDKKPFRQRLKEDLEQSMKEYIAKVKSNVKKQREVNRLERIKKQNKKTSNVTKMVKRKQPR